MITLLNMGFEDNAHIRRVLRLAKNDLNDAVALLMDEDTGTAFEGMEEEGLKDTETQHGSDEGEMDIPPLLDSKVGEVYQDAPSGEPPSYDEAVNPSPSSNGARGSVEENMDTGPLEFPTTNLYELEDRVFVESWSIPYKREESLGKCLLSATRFAQEGRCGRGGCHNLFIIGVARIQRCVIDSLSGYMQFTCLTQDLGLHA